MGTQKTCRITGQSFTITEQDQAFYTKMQVPEPTLCPQERQRRRMCWRNERNLYHRKCDLCSKQIISIYHNQSPFPVYCNNCWWSDKWTPESFGQDFDFNRPFFEQYHQLQLKVPRLALFQKNTENSDYTNHCEDIKNCYLCNDTGKSENIYYSKWMINCQDCCDCYNVEDSQLSYEVQYHVGSYNNIHCYFSDFSTDSAFLYNSTNCKDCFMCSNLNRQQYCIRNQQFSKEEYEKFINQIDLGSHKQISGFYQEYLEMVKSATKRASLQIMCENCTGDRMYKCKNVHDSYDTIESQDCRHCYEAGHLTDCYDVYESAFNCELQYECHGCNRCQNVKFGHVSYDNHDCEYIDTCHNSNKLFGCIGLKRKSLCILNKQYNETEFIKLRKKIINHMTQTNEFGEFFPARFSPFGYNETVAQEHFPLTKEEAIKANYNWYEATNPTIYQGQKIQIPDNIKDATDSICKQILTCETSNKHYKIIPQELKFYRQQNIAIPRKSPQQRYLDRLTMRNPYKLWDQTCTKCQTHIKASYPPGSEPEILCEKCYQDLVYK